MDFAKGEVPEIVHRIRKRLADSFADICTSEGIEEPFDGLLALVQLTAAGVANMPGCTGTNAEWAIRNLVAQISELSDWNIEVGSTDDLTITGRPHGDTPQ